MIILSFSSLTGILVDLYLFPFDLILFLFVVPGQRPSYIKN